MKRKKETGAQPHQFNLSHEERKINLTNIFGKAATGVGVAGMAVVAYELGALLVGAVNTAASSGFNPADHLAPTLVAFAVSMAGGLSGMYFGRKKIKLASEFNYQVRKEFANMGFELVEEDGVDFSSGGSRPKEKWVRRDSYRDGYGPVVYQPTHDRFFEGFWLASIMNSGSGSSSSGGGGSSSSGRGNGKGAAAALAIIVAGVALAAAAFVSYKSFKLNFIEKPEDLLTGPDPDVFGLEESRPLKGAPLQAPTVS